MKHAFIIAILATPLAGCFVRTGPPTRTVVREQRTCPPAHHYENGACVHNGHGHGDHDDDHGHGHGHGHD
jgi:hypothetical protein